MVSQRFCAASECGHSVLIHDKEGACGWRGCQCKRLVVGFTQREFRVLRELAKGNGYKQIGRTLGMTTKSVGCHIDNIARRTGISKRSRIVLCAIRAGIIPIESLPQFVPLVEVNSASVAAVNSGSQTPPLGQSSEHDRGVRTQ